MEVEPHVISSFDLSSGDIPAFPFPTTTEKSPESRSATADQMFDIGGARAANSAITRCPSNVVMKVHKVYRSYRTRRMLPDSAVVAEELWWQALNFVRLNHSTISFFDISKPETAATRSPSSTSRSRRRRRHRVKLNVIRVLDFWNVRVLDLKSAVE